jgi:uncharacterized repeat protein (TIGR02543 family)
MKKFLLLMFVSLLAIMASSIQSSYAFSPESNFEGKHLLGFGDSIAAGSGAELIGYTERIGELFDMNYQNYAQAGMTVTAIDGSDNNLIYHINRAITAGEEADYILFNGSTNDAGTDGIVTGTLTADYVTVLDNTTLYGAAEEAMSTMKSTWPNAIIIYVRPHKMDSRDIRQDTYGDIMVEVAQKYSIPVVSLYESAFDTNDAIIKELYTYDTYDAGTGDGTHPNALGYDTFYVPAVIGKMIEARNIVVPYFDSQTSNGLTLTYEAASGEFTLDGTATGATLFDLMLPRVLKSTHDYYIQYFYVSGSPSFAAVDNFLRTYVYGETAAASILFTNTNYLTDANAIQIYDFDSTQLRFELGTSFDNFTFKLQIEQDEFTEYANPTSSILSDEQYNISTVTFDSNGGTPITAINVSSGTTVDQPLSPIKDGYIFYGWYIDEDLTTQFDFGSNVNEDITLYAKWVVPTTGTNIFSNDTGTVEIFGIAWYWLAIAGVAGYYFLGTKKGRKSVGFKK